MGKEIRLDKFLCACLDISRKEAKEFIKKGRIQIEGNIAKKADQKIQPEQDKILCDGEELCFEEFHYLMFHKPAGVISATKDRQERTVMDFIQESYKERLFPVGRLDKDTEGLLLLTDDGELAHNLLSPRKHVKKTYFAKVSGEIGAEAVKAFAEGIPIGKDEIAKPAVLEMIKSGEKVSEVLITITEGKFHQVKRMIKSAGSEVLYLKRLSMGSLSLDPALPVGKYRRLSKDEIQHLKEETC